MLQRMDARTHLRGIMAVYLAVLIMHRGGGAKMEEPRQVKSGHWVPYITIQKITVACVANQRRQLNLRRRLNQYHVPRVIPFLQYLELSKEIVAVHMKLIILKTVMTL